MYSFSVDTQTFSASQPPVLPQTLPLPEPLQKTALPGNVTKLSRIRAVLSGGTPGYWASNHLEEVNHYTGWNYVAVHAMAKQLAQCQVVVEEIDDRDNHRPLPHNHPRCQLLRRPNPEQSGGEFRYAIALQLQITGSALVWVVRNALGVPVELYVIPTALAIPQPPGYDYPLGSYRIAPLASWNTQLDLDQYEPPGALGQLLVSGAVVDFRDIKAIRWPHPIYLSDGFGPVAAGALAVDVSEQQQRAWWYALKNGSKIGNIFELDADYSNLDVQEQQAFAEELKARQSGTPNWRKDMILPPGVKATPNDWSPVDMDFANSHPMIRDAVLALHHTPSMACGVAEAGSYAQFYAAMLQYVDLAVTPLCLLLSEKLTDGTNCRQWRQQEVILTPRRFDDPAQKDTELNTHLRSTAIRVNEYRDLVGLPPIQGPEGERIIGAPPAPAQAAGPLAGLLGAGQPQEKPPPEEKPQEVPEGKPGAPLAEPAQGSAPQRTPVGTGLPNPVREDVPRPPKRASMALLEIPDVRQRDHFSCGAAAAFAVGRGFFGAGPETLDQWKDALGTSLKKSTSPPAIVEYLTSLGLTVEARAGMTIADLETCIQRGMPVICPVQDWGVDLPGTAEFRYGHYLTVIGVSQEMGLIFCQDSSEDNAIAGGDSKPLSAGGSIQMPGRIMVTFATWEQVWHDQDVDGTPYHRYGIAVGPRAQQGGEVLPAKLASASQPIPDLDAMAPLIADILYQLFGDRTLQDLQATLHKAWEAQDHPRGKGGRFIPRGSAEAVAAAKEAVGKALRGEGGNADEVCNHLAILTVKQLQQVYRENRVKQMPDATLRGLLIQQVKDKLAPPTAGTAGPDGKATQPEEPWRQGGSEPEPGKVYNAPTDQLHVDPARFQYKLNTDKSGVTDELKNVQTFNPDFAGVISVWKDPADGKTYVANGHHRVELASRLGQSNLAIRYVNAANAREARAVGALINIAEGRGTAVDAAKFMRDAQASAEDLAKHGVSLKGRLAQDATTLTRLNDRAFDRLARGTLDQQKALAVAKHLDNPDLQEQLFRLVDQREDQGKETSPKLLEEMAREMASTPTAKNVETTLFGDIESEESLFVPRNELKAHVRTELAREVNDWLAVASQRRAERVGGAGNVLDVDKNRELATQAEQVKNVFDTLVNRKGAVSDALNAAAEAYSKARSRRDRDAIKQRTVAAVRDAVFAEAGVGKSGEQQQVDSGGAGPGGDGGSAAGQTQPGTETREQAAPESGRGDPEQAGLKPQVGDSKPGLGHKLAPPGKTPEPEKTPEPGPEPEPEKQPEGGAKPAPAPGPRPPRKHVGYPDRVPLMQPGASLVHLTNPEDHDKLHLLGDSIADPTEREVWNSKAHDLMGWGRIKLDPGKLKQAFGEEGIASLLDKGLISRQDNWVDGTRQEGYGLTRTGKVARMGQNAGVTDLKAPSTPPGGRAAGQQPARPGTGLHRASPGQAGHLSGAAQAVGEQGRHAGAAPRDAVPASQPGLGLSQAGEGQKAQGPGTDAC